MRLKEGLVEGVQTPVGIVPAAGELELEGTDIAPADLARILSIDGPRWRAEMARRDRHLAQFDGLPDEIWAAHRRVTAALDALPD
jgi:phosphoenolpyruvate carboxykinase (GTP)